MTAEIISIVDRVARAAGYLKTPLLADLDELRDEARERVKQRRIYAPQGSAAYRDNARKQVLLHLDLLADPRNDWQRERIELGLESALFKYRLALSSYRAEGPVPLPGKARLPPRSLYMEAAE